MPLIAGAYSQLSPGTPTPILERALSDVYNPVLTYLYRHPEVRLHLYLPGPVLEWFEQNHPEVNMLIADLVKKEQLELLTGAFQQPILHILPVKDRSGQIEATTTFIRKRFGKRSKTVWFFNQIWNPSFVSTMGMCTVDRLLISPYDRLHGILMATEPFVMQDMGKTVEVFPTDEGVDELVADLGAGRIGFKEFSDGLARIGFDEADTYETVMVNLDHLMQACSLNPSLPPVPDLFAMILERYGNGRNEKTELLSTIPMGTIGMHGYLNSGWYGWDSVPVDIDSFNQMFIKYGELNHLYGRLVYLTELSRLFRKNRDVKKRVESLLQKAGCGAAYVFDASGGCYRGSYRKYTYRYLNEAESVLSIHEAVPYPREVDIDFDGRNEIVWLGRNLGVVVDPKGGTLAEINHLPTGWNYGDTFTGYAVESTRLSFPSLRDGSFQRSFNDVFLPSGAQLDHYAKHVVKQTFDAGDIPYTLAVTDRNGNEITARCRFEDLPFGMGTLDLTKRYRLRMHTIVVDFTLGNEGKHRSKGIFGSELNLSVGTRGVHVPMYTVEKSRNRNLAAGRVVSPSLKNIRIPDEVNKTLLSVASDVRFTLHKDDFQVKLATVMGLEVLYGYTQVLPLWDFDLLPGESTSWTIGFRIERRTRPNVAIKR